MAEPQSEFRLGRSVQDHVFTAKTIISRSFEVGKETYIGFVHMEKAFDKEPRKGIWECLTRMGFSQGM